MVVYSFLLKIEFGNVYKWLGYFKFKLNKSYSTMVTLTMTTGSLSVAYRTKFGFP